MRKPQNIFAHAISLGQLESRYAKLSPGVLSFLDVGCCFDTQPPMPSPGP